MMQELLNRVERLWRRTEDIPAFQWAEVRSISPLKVRFDGVANDSAGSPSTLTKDLMVGDRVQVLVVRNRAIVIGRGGASFPRRFTTVNDLNSWTPADGTTSWVTTENTQYIYADGAWHPTSYGDTGWINISPTSPFRLYTGGHFKIRRIGKIVNLSGVLSTDTENYISGSTPRTMGYTPADMKPSEPVNNVMQGSTEYKWNLRVETDGEITAARYGDHPANRWLPFSTTWFTD